MPGVRTNFRTLKRNVNDCKRTFELTVVKQAWYNKSVKKGRKREQKNEGRTGLLNVRHYRIHMRASSKKSLKLGAAPNAEAEAELKLSSNARRYEAKQA